MYQYDKYPVVDPRDRLGAGYYTATKPPQVDPMEPPTKDENGYPIYANPGQVTDGANQAADERLAQLQIAHRASMMGRYMSEFRNRQRQRAMQQWAASRQGPNAAPASSLRPGLNTAGAANYGPHQPQLTIQPAQASGSAYGPTGTPTFTPGLDTSGSDSMGPRAGTTYF